MELKRLEKNGHYYWTVDSWAEEGIQNGFIERSLNVRDENAWSTFSSDPLLLLQQEHAKRIVIAGAEGPSLESLKEKRETADAWLIQGSSSLYGQAAIGIQTADCFPVLLRSKSEPVIAAAHIGWRGARAGLLVELLVAISRSGAGMNTLEMAIGPGAQNCCYEIQADVKRALNESFNMVNSPPISGVLDVVEVRDGKLFGNIRDLLVAQAVFCGVPRNQIAASAECTITNSNFFSYRREKEQAGRQLSFIGPVMPGRKI